MWENAANEGSKDHMVQRARVNPRVDYFISSYIRDGYQPTYPFRIDVSVLQETFRKQRANGVRGKTNCSVAVGPHRLHVIDVCKVDQNIVQ